MSAMWKLEKDLCRCCHAEGSFKHLSDPCFLLGQEEIYSIMLQDCLDIKIVPMTGPLCDATYTICESCVVRLRDASNFKRQVQDCEERFKEMYSKNMIKGFEVKDEPFESDADMKQEFQSIEEDEDDDDAFMKFDDDDASSYEEHEEHEEMITVEVEAEPRAKGKGKGKAKPKPKSKKAPAKKTKTKEKSIKEETEDLTEAAVSGEKKKGKPPGSKPKRDLAKYCDEKDKEDGTKSYVCTICDREYKHWNNWLQHYNHVHLKRKKKTHPCVLCHEELIPRHRWSHMEQQHGWKAPTCDACGKKFSYPHQVLKHQKHYHMGEKNHTCEQCGQAFSDIKNLKQHMFKHSDVRNFKCQYCSKAFKTPKYLRLHVKIHLNDKRCVCPVCQEAFVQTASLKYHMSKRHPDYIR
ncbi:zinc finger protein with KRAB and SCAN domains 1-like isoform X7 [Cydia splendana]|uniref:zinc finger protein with KRAB and SCAN domains 1-like isoform X7 n=1 Tax=Cydia splendana TaxID=1100963 RepID=UPI00300C7683